MEKIRFQLEDGKSSRVLCRRADQDRWTAYLLVSDSLDDEAEQPIF